MAITDDVKSYWERLSSRDRNLLMLLGVVFGGFVVFMTTFQLNQAASKRQTRIDTKMTQLREVAQLTSGYRQAETQRQELERKLKDHAVKNLFSYLEELSKREALEIGGMSDKGQGPVEGSGATKLAQQSVEVTLTRVPLDKLTKFLNDIENNPGMVRVTRLQLRPREEDNVLDAWFTVSTYYLGG